MKCWRCDTLMPVAKYDAPPRSRLWLDCRYCGARNTMHEVTPPAHDCCACPWHDWQRDYPGAETGRCLELGIVTVARGGGCTGRSRTT